MNYEQKYNKMLDAARYWHDVSEGDIPAVLEEIFPELRESEDDKIRKALIELFKVENFNRYITLNGIDVDDVIAWLEKQGTSYTKRGGDDAYVECMAFAKDELEKQKPAWSEEDEEILQWIISDIKRLINDNKKANVIADKELDLLKSIKQRIGG